MIRNYFKIVFGNLARRKALNAIKSIPEVAIASTGFITPADEGVAFMNIKCAGKEVKNV